MKANAVSKSNPWLYWFAVLTALATLALIGIGGLVTSHEAGMSVPDWPTTYGYNMFLFPINKWLGGIFYEHSHRLLASLVGLMTTILAVWLWLKDRRPWMAWLGVAAFLLVVAQGVLGGLRVTMHMDSLGIYHATIAQLFFVLTCAIALFTSRWWLNLVSVAAGCDRRYKNLRRLVLATTILIFVQLIIAAAMRHQHAGLAISDFPLAYGGLWPDTSAEAVAGYNAQRVSMNAENPITAFQIELQMAHRIVALAILILTAGCAWRTRAMGAPDTAPARMGNNAETAETVLGAPIYRTPFAVLADADCYSDRSGRGDDLDKQGRRCGDSARAGRGAGAGGRHIVVCDCFSGIRSGDPCPPH